jgi:hypothetical protein
MTAVAELRAAADKIRARAEVATPGPWKADHREYPEIVYGGERLATNVISGSRWNGEASIFENNDDAYHIALWHPGIALLVAAWLDQVADVHQEGFREASGPALTLAQAINATEVA